MSNYKDKLSAHKKHLRSRYWKELRHKVQQRCSFRCESCNKLDSVVFGSDPFHLHHKTYKRFGKEKMQDVSYLCPDCHKKEHLKSYAPKISDIRLQTTIEPKQPKPKARSGSSGKKKKYALSPKERRFLSKFKK